MGLFRNARGARRSPTAVGRRSRPRKRVLVIVQNLSVPLDRRVWLECRSLVEQGYQVSVVCPKAPGDPSYAVLDGVILRKYTPPPATRGPASFVVEFAYCWLRTAALTFVAAFREGFDTIQACNPPDTYFALALLFKPFGVRFVYDQHDLCPEVYRSRFGRHEGSLLAMLYALERATYRVADHVISANDTYRQVALNRAPRQKHPNEVTVVRSGPDLARFVATPARPQLRRQRRFLACYVGVMGPQDGVDRAVRALAHYVHELGRDDCQFAFLGDGDVYEEIQDLVDDLGVRPWTTFTGMVGDDTLLPYLSTADVGLCPDPKTPLNDVSTMNKALEYMAIGVPVVSFDLRETQASAGDSAVFVPSDDVNGFAAALAALLDDPGRRAEMGAAGRARVRSSLAWNHQAPAYLAVHDRLSAPRRRGGRLDRRSAPPARPAPETG